MLLLEKKCVRPQAELGWVRHVKSEDIFIHCETLLKSTNALALDISRCAQLSVECASRKHVSLVSDQKLLKRHTLPHTNKIISKKRDIGE